MRPRRLRISARGAATALVVGSVYAFLLAPLLVVALSSLDGRKQAFFNFPPQ